MSRGTCSLLSLWLVACSGAEEEPTPPSDAVSSCAEDPRAEPLAVGNVFPGSVIELVLTGADPLPPSPGDNVLSFDVTGATGCVLTVETWMPDHGHGGPAPVVTAIDESGYEVAVRFTMGGFWEVSVDALCDDGAQDALIVPVCVE